MSQSTRRSGLLQRLGLLAVSVVLCALLAEERWRSWQRERGPSTVFEATLGWRLKPDTTSRHRTDDFDVEVHIDSSGRRVIDRQDSSQAADGGPVEIAFVGDSLTFGWGVEAHQSFPYSIGRELGLDILNFGVAGYGTDQAYLLLTREVLALQPTTVILTLCSNDFYEVVSSRMYGRSKPRFELDGDRLVLSTAGERASWLERSSAIVRTLLLLLDRSPLVLEGDRLQQSRRLMRRLIRAMDEASRNAGARFLVVHEHNPWLAQALDQDGVERLDIGPAMRQAAVTAPVTFAQDTLHWNAHGHQTVAETVRAFLHHEAEAGAQG